MFHPLLATADLWEEGREMEPVTIPLPHFTRESFQAMAQEGMTDSLVKKMELIIWGQKGG